MKRIITTVVIFLFVVLSHAQPQDTVQSMIKNGVTMKEVVVIGNKNQRDIQMKSSQNLVSISKSYLDANIAGSLMQSLAGIPGVKAMNVGSCLLYTSDAADEL